MTSQTAQKSNIFEATKSKKVVISKVKGFNDYTGEDAIKRAEIKKILVDTFEKYNFEPAETPIVEYEEFVRGDNIQDEAVSDIFKLQDKGKRKLALRYEFTFQLKRLMKNMVNFIFIESANSIFFEDSLPRSQLSFFGSKRSSPDFHIKVSNMY